jgi:hypothetical protein
MQRLQNRVRRQAWSCRLQSFGTAPPVASCPTVLHPRRGHVLLSMSALRAWLAAWWRACGTRHAALRLWKRCVAWHDYRVRAPARAQALQRSAPQSGKAPDHEHHPWHLSSPREKKSGTVPGATAHAPHCPAYYHKRATHRFSSSVITVRRHRPIVCASGELAGPTPAPHHLSVIVCMVPPGDKILTSRTVS